jgi:hypothetical protein
LHLSELFDWAGRFGVGVTLAVFLLVLLLRLAGFGRLIQDESGRYRFVKPDPLVWAGYAGVIGMIAGFCFGIAKGS